MLLKKNQNKHTKPNSKCDVSYKDLGSMKFIFSKLFTIESVQTVKQG